MSGVYSQRALGKGSRAKQGTGVCVSVWFPERSWARGCVGRQEVREKRLWVGGAHYVMRASAPPHSCDLGCLVVGAVLFENGRCYLRLETDTHSNCLTYFLQVLHGLRLCNCWVPGPGLHVVPLILPTLKAIGLERHWELGS